MSGVLVVAIIGIAALAVWKRGQATPPPIHTPTATPPSSLPKPAIVLAPTPSSAAVPVTPVIVKNPPSGMTREEQQTQQAQQVIAAAPSGSARQQVATLDAQILSTWLGLRGTTPGGIEYNAILQSLGRLRSQRDAIAAINGLALSANDPNSIYYVNPNYVPGQIGD